MSLPEGKEREKYLLGLPKRYCELGSTKCFMEKYHNSGSYNDLYEYKRVLNRGTSEYKKAKYSFEKKLANNVKTDPKSFYAYVRSISKTKTSVSPLKMEMVF